MEMNEKYIWIDTVMGELKFHKEVYEEVVGQYPEEEQGRYLEFLHQGCKNFSIHPQDALNDLERSLNKHVQVLYFVLI